MLVSFILLLSFFGLAGLLVSGIDHHFGGGPVPRELEDRCLHGQWALLCLQRLVFVAPSNFLCVFSSASPKGVDLNEEVKSYR